MARSLGHQAWMLCCRTQYLLLLLLLDTRGRCPLLLLLHPPPYLSASSSLFCILSSSVSSLLSIWPLFCAASELGHERTQLSGAIGFLPGPLQLSLSSGRTWEAFSSDRDLSPHCSVFLETWLPVKHTVGPRLSWD